VTLPTAAGALATARADLGYTEVPFGSNCQKFSFSWGCPCQAWCADAVCRWLADAGALDVPHRSYTPALAREYQDAGRYGQTPSIGAVVFFAWPELGRIAHTGLVESIRPDKRLITLEGNTDVAGGRTGGRVMRKVRAANIAGYGYPKYLLAKPARRPDPIVALGSRGQSVLNVQRALNLCGNRIRLDGRFGPDTDRILRLFQQHRGIPVTGRTDATTWAALRKVAHG
jgi:hypothetical protein